MNPQRLLRIAKEAKFATREANEKKESYEQAEAEEEENLDKLCSKLKTHQDEDERCHTTERVLQECSKKASEPRSSENSVKSVCSD